MLKNKEPPILHTNIHTRVPHPCKHCSETRRAIMAGRQPLGWGTSGDTAQASLSTWLGKDNPRLGRPALQGSVSIVCSGVQGCLPHLALPFVPLLSSDLTASIALGRELLTNRAGTAHKQGRRLQPTFAGFCTEGKHQRLQSSQISKLSGKHLGKEMPEGGK